VVFSCRVPPQNYSQTNMDVPLPIMGHGHELQYKINGEIAKEKVESHFGSNASRINK
jgi:hypothetical protein